MTGEGLNNEATRFISLPRNLNVTLGSGNNNILDVPNRGRGKSVTGGANATRS